MLLTELDGSRLKNEAFTLRIFLFLRQLPIKFLAGIPF